MCGAANSSLPQMDTDETRRPTRGRRGALALRAAPPTLIADVKAGVVAVELKVAPQYDKRDEAQLLNELKATGSKVGLLINFGRAKVEYKRLVF